MSVQRDEKRTNTRKKVRFPEFIKRYFLKIVRLYAMIATPLLLIVVLMTISVVKRSNPSSFSSYEELESLYASGKRYVLVDTSSMHSLPVPMILQQTPLTNYRTIALGESTVLLNKGNGSLFRKTSICCYISYDKKKVTVNSLLEHPEVKMRLAAADNLRRLMLNAEPIVLTYEEQEYFIMIYIFIIIVLSITLAVFLYLLISSGMVLIHPTRSKTYRMISEHGCPESILEEIDLNFSKRRYMELYQNDIIYDEKYILLVYNTYIYAAPLKDILWAYVFYHHISGGSTYWSEGSRALRRNYGLRFVFATGGEKTILVHSKERGISILKALKAKNPNLLIGYNDRLEHFWRNGPEAFKNQVLTNVEALQKETSAGEQGDVVGFFFGSGQWHHNS